MNKVIEAKKALPIRLILLCSFFFLLNGCTDNSVYEKNIPITNHLWSYQQAPEFETHITDKNQKLDLFLNIRHSSKYKYSNLSLIIQEVNPKKQEKSYRLELQLAEPDGRWKGVGTGNILSYQVLFLKDYLFADTGMYTFKVKQNMSINPLPEILDVGIRITNEKQN